MPAQGNGNTVATANSTDKAARDARHTAQDHSQNRQQEIIEALKAGLVEHALNINASVTAKVR